MLITTGPRTDVAQVTKLTYFSDTDADLGRRGQLQTLTDALNHVTTYGNGASPYNTYSPFGMPASFTDPNKVLTDFTFDARGRRLSQIVKGVTNDPADLQTSITYDTEGKPTRVAKPLGNAVSAAYDANDNLTSLTRLDAGGLQREQAVYGYDAGSRPISTTLQSCTLPSSACSTWNAAFASSSAFSTNNQVTYEAFRQRRSGHELSLQRSRRLGQNRLRRVANVLFRELRTRRHLRSEPCTAHAIGWRFFTADVQLRFADERGWHHGSWSAKWRDNGGFRRFR
ncbi:MAG: hypothetical protein ABSB70_12320 [Candidatus Velthaea sp.]